MSSHLPGDLGTWQSEHAVAIAPTQQREARSRLAFKPNLLKDYSPVMDLLNATKMQAGYTLGLNAEGRESIVVVVKGTYGIPENGEMPALHEVQVPLVEADTFTGEPGFSAVSYESDYAPVKHRCDVLLNGSAYAPNGEPATRVHVGLQVGEMKKAFDVVGDRVWDNSMIGFKPSPPIPFLKKQISYANAFGGMDTSHEDPQKHAAFVDNPVGAGFFKNLDAKVVVGQPLPNTESIGQPIQNPNGTYKPMALSPLGRQFNERAAFAGTYDDAWVENTFPFLPADFDERYFQAAPVDQQIAYPEGGEPVFLYNLTPDGKRQFNLSRLKMPVVFFRSNGEEVETQGVADTLIFEPDAARFIVVWRASMPLKRNIFEVVQAVAGRMPKGWYRARKLGKTYHASLGALVRSRQEDD